MKLWNVVYLVNKSFVLIVLKENVDHLNKKRFCMKKVPQMVHKILFEKLGFVW